MLLTLEEIGVEAAMILATVAALVCFVALLVVRRPGATRDAPHARTASTSTARR